MSFLAPVFLYLSSFAVLPIVFHLLFRQRRKTINVPSLIFFLRTDPKLAAKHNIRKYLILFCRCMIIFFLMAALARPQIIRSSGSDNDSNIVIFVDNTASMARKAMLDSNRTCLEVAKDVVGGWLKKKNSSYKIVVLPLVPVVSGEYSATGDLDEIIQTQAGGDIESLLKRISALDIDHEMVLHFFTDMQSEIFENNNLSVPENVRKIIFHRVSPVENTDANICIREIEVKGQPVLPGHPGTVTVKLENNSDFQGSVQVSIADDRGVSQGDSISLSARSVKSKDFIIAGLTPGVHPVNIEISGDTFVMDNYSSAVIYCRQAANVVFGGQPQDFGLVPVALSPFGESEYSGINNIFRAVNRIFEYCSQAIPEMIVLTYAGAAELEENHAGWLERYVENGGSLLILPFDGQNTLEVPDYIEVRPGRLIASQGKKMQVSANGSEFWYRIFGGNITAKQDMALYNYYPLTLSTPSVSLLKCDLTESVLAHRPFGKGNMFFSGFVFDNKWTSLPRDPLMVVMLQNFVTMSLDSSDKLPFELFSVGAGHIVDNVYGSTVKAVSLTGPNLDFNGKAEDIIWPAFSSVIKVNNGEKQSYICISSDSAEGKTDYLDDSAVKVQVAANFSGIVQNINSLEGSDVDILKAGKITALFLPFIIISVLFWLFENILTNMSISGRRSE